MDNTLTPVDEQVDPDATCVFCDRAECPGDCQNYYDAVADETAGDDQ
jgi:hypothetical protein